MTTVTTRRLDGRGWTITTYVMFDVAAELAGLEVGDHLELVTDDFEPFEHDVAAWCRASGHELVSSDTTTEGRRFVIEKGTPEPKASSLAMVVSTDGLEELLSLSFALAAALEGMEVHLYFQGPGVHVLSRGFKPRLKGWARPFSRFAASGLAKSGHIPAQDKLRQLRSLGARIYMCGPSMDHFKVSREDLIFDDLPLVEYLTFMSVMEQADVHIYN